MEIKNKKESENSVADHLSSLELADNEASEMHINDSFSDAQFLALSHAKLTLWFANFVNYPSVGVAPIGLSSQQKKIFFTELKTITRRILSFISTMLIRLFGDASQRVR